VIRADLVRASLFQADLFRRYVSLRDVHLTGPPPWAAGQRDRGSRGGGDGEHDEREPRLPCLSVPVYLISSVTEFSGARYVD